MVQPKCMELYFCCNSLPVGFSAPEPCSSTIIIIFIHCWLDKVELWKSGYAIHLLLQRVVICITIVKLKLFACYYRHV